jgi:hypothetical protein
MLITTRVINVSYVMFDADVALHHIGLEVNL